jgi:hypothetical protein
MQTGHHWFAGQITAAFATRLDGLLGTQGTARRHTATSTERVLTDVPLTTALTASHFASHDHAAHSLSMQSICMHGGLLVAQSPCFVILASGSASYLPLFIEKKVPKHVILILLHTLVHSPADNSPAVNKICQRSHSGTYEAFAERAGQ